MLTQSRGLDHFTEGLAAVYSRMARALKPDAPLAFRVVAQFRSGHGPVPVLFECYRIRTDSGMPRLDIRFSTSHLMMVSTR